MIPTKTTDITVTGNLNGDKIAMKFDENSLAHIMSVLTDLYSDPELAVIREYSTNAWDSHVEAGNKSPIHVTLPSPLSPYFVVEDFGVGMSPDDIAEIYSKYGASTKRQTDEQVGMLGLGCKSALTYVSQFNVTAVKGGVRTQVNVGRNEDGTGTMEVVDTASTNAPNGVKITVPVKNQGTFNVKANNFFKFWNDAQVLVNGKPVEKPKVTEVTPGIFMDPNTREDFVVMGNVAYPVESEHQLYKGASYYRQFGVIAYVEIGSVNFTPARESLHYTNKTKETLARIRREFEAGYHAAIKKEIENSPTHADAIKCRNKWEGILGYQNNVIKSVRYKGLEIPKQIAIGETATCYNPSAYRYQTQSETYLPASKMDNCIIVTGFDVAQLSSTHKAKVKQWQVENDVVYNAYYFVTADFGGDWTSGIPKIDFADIKAVTLPKNTSNGSGYGPTKAIPGSFNEVTKSGGVVEVNDLTDQTPIVYIMAQEKKEWDYAGNLVAYMNGSHRMIVVGLNRLEKFNRDFPRAIHYKDYLLEERERVTSALTDDDKFLMNFDAYQFQSLLGIDASKIKDPDVAEAARLVNNKGSNARVDAWNTLANLTRYLPGVAMGKPTTTKTISLKDYPLLKDAYGRRPCTADHATLYINAVYAAQNGDN